MNMKSLIILLMLLIPTQVFADKDTYIKGSLGVTMMGDIDSYFDGYGNSQYEGSYETDVGVSFGAAIGKSFASGFDIELEFSSRNVDTSNHVHKKLNTTDEFGDPYVRPGHTFDKWDEELGMQTLMVNALYNFKNSSRFTPYLGVGAGVAFLEFDEDLYKDNQNFSYQLMAGVDAEITKDFSVLVGYRYLYAGELKRNKAPTYYGAYGDILDVNDDVIGQFDESNLNFDDSALNPGEISVDMDAHIVDVSLKYYF